MAIRNQTITGALGEIADSLEKIKSGIGPYDIDKLAVYRNAISDPREELIIRSTKGTLTFAARQEDGREVRYGLLNMRMFKLDGTPDGTHLTVWQPLSNETFGVPPDFRGPYDKPDPIPLIRMTANSKAVWTFADGDEIRATGPANLLLVRLKDGSKLFVISVAAIITGGTGKYRGCTGVKTALGSSFIPREITDIENVPYGTPVEGVTVETFRVITAQDMAEQPKPDRPRSRDYTGPNQC
jgi:hypothetical protein